MPATKKNIKRRSKNNKADANAVTVVFKSTSNKTLFPEKVKAMKKLLKNAILLPS